MSAACRRRARRRLRRSPSVDPRDSCGSSPRWARSLRRSWYRSPGGGRARALRRRALRDRFRRRDPRAAGREPSGRRRNERRRWARRPARRSSSDPRRRRCASREADVRAGRETGRSHVADDLLLLDAVPDRDLRRRRRGVRSGTSGRRGGSARGCQGPARARYSTTPSATPRPACRAVLVIDAAMGPRHVENRVATRAGESRADATELEGAARNARSTLVPSGRK